MTARSVRLLLLFLWASLGTPSAQAFLFAPYVEFGLGSSKIKNGDTFFNLSGAHSPSTGLGENLSFYVPVTPLRFIGHLEVGLQNRIATGTAFTGQYLDTCNPHFALRVEIWRFYAGGGYAPFTYSSTDGISHLTNNQLSQTYFTEFGAIWRVTPEFQITANLSNEYEIPKVPGNRMAISHYGIGFRFPLFPKESTGTAGRDFDGFRYPFGFMR